MFYDLHSLHYYATLIRLKLTFVPSMMRQPLSARGIVATNCRWALHSIKDVKELNQKFKNWRGINRIKLKYFINSQCACFTYITIVVCLGCIYIKR